MKRENAVSGLLSWRWVLIPAALLHLACPQQTPCSVGTGGTPYTVLMSPKPGQTFGPSCAPAITTEWSELWFFDKFSGTPELNDAVFRTQTFTDKAKNPTLIDPTLVARGRFDSTYTVIENKEEVCHVETFSPAVKGPVSYAFHNAVFLEGAAFQGNSMSGELTYSEGACTIEYDVSALWPAVLGCESDVECQVDVACCADHALDPTDAQQLAQCQAILECSNGINTQLQTRCVPLRRSFQGETSACVTAAPFPSLK